MPSSSKGYKQPVFDDNWPECENVNAEQPSSPENPHGTYGSEDSAAVRPDPVDTAGNTPRRSQRNTQKPIRYADTWARS